MIAEYGVYGMVEWVALIPTKRNIVKVRFKGGKRGGYGFGATPATFRTENPVVMRLIEKSSYYKKGKIERLSYDESDSQPKILKESNEAGEVKNTAPGALVYVKGDRQ